MLNILFKLPKSKWVKDSATDFCNECCMFIKPRMFYSNKHHCRYCGSIVCASCSTNKIDEDRICNTCYSLYKMQKSHNKLIIGADDVSDDDIEELSPYSSLNETIIEDTNVASMYNMDNSSDYSSSSESESDDHSLSCDYCDRLDFNEFHDHHDVSPYHAAAPAPAVPRNSYGSTRNSLSSRRYVRNQHDSDTLKSLLVNGFIRRFWRNNLQYTSYKLYSYYPSSDIINLFILWLSISDSFDEYNTHNNIIIYNKLLFNIMHYSKIQYIERISSWNMECYHSFGNDIITRNGRAIWKFKCCGYENQKQCILIGIIESSKIDHDGGNIPVYNSFNDNMYNGYCLYTADWNIYHSETKGISFGNYGMKNIKLTSNDIITMELDLTYTGSRGDDNCGILKYYIHQNGKKIQNNNNDIAFNDININKTYKLAIGMYLKDKLAMFQVL